MYLGILDQHNSDNSLSPTPSFFESVVLHLLGDSFTDESSYNHIVYNIREVTREQGGFKITPSSNNWLDIAHNDIFKLEDKSWFLEFDLFCPSRVGSRDTFLFNIHSNSFDYSIDVKITSNNRLSASFLILDSSTSSGFHSTSLVRSIPNVNFITTGYQNFKIDCIRSEGVNSLTCYYNGVSFGSRFFDGYIKPTEATPKIGNILANTGAQNPFFIKNIKLTRIFQN